MRILALDTSGKTASCAVLSDGVLFAENFLGSGLTHSQTIMPMMLAMLSGLKMSLKDIDAFAVSIGPGSFTGIRIGISAVKGMSMATGKPCAGVSTLYALAAGVAPVHGYISPALDARRNQVYTSLFQCEGKVMRRICDDEAISALELESRLSSLDGPVLIAGDGAGLCSSKMGIICRNDISQRASGVAKAAFWDNIFVSGEQLDPIYLRLPQAQRELIEKKEISQ